MSFVEGSRRPSSAAPGGSSAGRRGRARLLAVAGVLALGPLARPAEDAVRLANGATVRGEILEYDERGVRIRLDSGRASFFSSTEVEGVDSAYSPSHTLAREALARRDDAAAAALFREALDSEKRPWARHQIRAGLLQALRRLGKLDEAAQLFLEIYAGRDDADVLALAPLVWGEGGAVSPESLALAGRWLADESPAARLLAASWLLQGPGAKRAAETLAELQTLDQRIGWMARAQLWRLKEKPTGEEIQRFRTLIGRMPASIRSGPQFALAASLAAHGDHEEAALAYLWVAYVYAPGGDLAAESLLRAAQASRRCGFSADSDKIYAEVVQVYPGTSWAVRAEKERASDAAPPSSP